jgi:hypothetical protein
VHPANPSRHTPLIPQNIAREVDRLVSMIFATYDLNNDNLLQQSEFRLVLANFPFLVCNVAPPP